MIRFAEPLAFALLLVVPIALWLAWRGRRRSTPKLLFSSIAILGSARPSMRLVFRPLPKLLLFAALLFLIAALARPQKPWSEHKRRVEGIDIMLVLDVSESMRALDFHPNRLEKSKEVVKEFIAGRTEDRIGVVIFGKDTFTLCPLTHDYAALQTFIDRVNFDLVDGQATAIGMGLANGVNKLKDSAAKSKVIILLTDGENNWGEIHPLTAAGIAKELKARTYTIGVGSKGPVEIPLRTASGQVVTRRVISNIDTDTLEQIATMTGGHFFEATDGESLRKIYGQIDKMERTKIDVIENNYYDELAHWLIIPALLMFGLAVLLEQSWLWSFP